MRFPKPFAQQPRPWIVAEMGLALCVIAFLDLVTSYRIRLLPFYAGPIFVIGWFCGRRAGLAAALISGGTWWTVNWYNGDPDFYSSIAAWEIFRHVGFFVIVALTGAALRSKSDIAAARIALLEHANRLEHEIVNISEAEQRRIGQDLHDGLCQYLAALSCSAASLREDLEKADRRAEAKTAAELARHLQDAVVQTRDLARGLVPAQVGQLGLPLALETLAQSVTLLHGLNCTFQADGDAAACDDDTAMHLYRITQEAINNATKHGKAENIAISLDRTDSVWTLRIADDGVGIGGGSGSDGMGLAIMRYRARMNGGEFKIERPDDGGTLVTCTARINSGRNEIAAA